MGAAIDFVVVVVVIDAVVGFYFCDEQLELPDFVSNPRYADGEELMERSRVETETSCALTELDLANLARPWK